MLNISYNISPRLKECLDKVEDLRKDILLNPISQSLEMSLKWEATFNRVYCSLKLAGNPLRREDMLNLLLKATDKKLSRDQKVVLKYKEALDYISQNWQGSQNAVGTQTIIDLNKIVSDGTLRIPKAGLQAILDYLQTERQSPIVQAAIIYIEIEKMQLFTKHNDLIAHLAADLFLHKYGYNLKGFLAYEKAWKDNEKAFRENHKRALDIVNLTLWIEYFAECILGHLEAVFLSMNKAKATASNSEKSLWELNERQKSVLNSLDQPHASITNRQVQKRHKISQITASRDLARLTKLGCLLPHGKGRSVRYTRV